MPWLLSLALRFGVPEKYAKQAVIAVLILLAFVAAFAAVKLHDRRVITNYDAKQEVQAQKAARRANDEAADQRATDTIAIAKKAQETHDVIQAQPDQPIAPTSRALACKRLHDLGRDPPACR